MTNRETSTRLDSQYDHIVGRIIAAAGFGLFLLSALFLMAVFS